MIVAISKAKRQGRDQHGPNDECESSACFLEAMKLQAKAMMGGPIILDEISLRNVEQPFFDHGDHEVLRCKNTEFWIDTPCLRRGLPVIDCQCMPPMHSHGDGGTFSGPQAAKRRQ